MDGAILAIASQAQTNCQEFDWLKEHERSKIIVQAEAFEEKHWIIDGVANFPEMMLEYQQRFFEQEATTDVYEMSEHHYQWIMVETAGKSPEKVAQEVKQITDREY